MVEKSTIIPTAEERKKFAGGQRETDVSSSFTKRKRSKGNKRDAIIILVVIIELRFLGVWKGI